MSSDGPSPGFSSHATPSAIAVHGGRPATAARSALEMPAEATALGRRNEEPPRLAMHRKRRNVTRFAVHHLRAMAEEDGRAHTAARSRPRRAPAPDPTRTKSTTLAMQTERRADGDERRARPPAAPAASRDASRARSRPPAHVEPVGVVAAGRRRRPAAGPGSCRRRSSVHLVGSQCTEQRLARLRERGGDRPLADAADRGDLGVREVGVEAQEDDQPPARRQLAQRRGELRVALGLDAAPGRAPRPARPRARSASPRAPSEGRCGRSRPRAAPRRGSDAARGARARTPPARRPGPTRLSPVTVASAFRKPR